MIKLRTGLKKLTVNEIITNKNYVTLFEKRLKYFRNWEFVRILIILTSTIEYHSR